MFNAANKSVGNEIYSIISHFGGTAMAVSQKLHVTLDTVKRWSREQRVPNSVYIRYKRESNPRLQQVQSLARVHKENNPLLRELTEDHITELYEIVVNLNENWDGEEVLPSMILQNMCEYYKVRKLVPAAF